MPGGVSPGSCGADLFANTLRTGEYSILATFEPNLAGGNFNADNYLDGQTFYNLDVVFATISYTWMCDAVAFVPSDGSDFETAEPFTAAMNVDEATTITFASAFTMSPADCPCVSDNFYETRVYKDGVLVDTELPFITETLEEGDYGALPTAFTIDPQAVASQTDDAGTYTIVMEFTLGTTYTDYTLDVPAEVNFVQ